MAIKCATTDEEPILVRSEYKLIPISPDDIYLIESRSEYVHIHTTASKPVITLGSLKSFEEKLSAGFMRVHRSYIVNLSKILFVRSKYIAMHNERIIPIGDAYEKQFREYLESI